LLDRIDQSLRFSRAALAVGDQHAGVGDHEHVGGRELLGSGVEVFVGVDVVGDLHRAREVGELHAALDRIRGADDRRLRACRRRTCENDKDDSDRPARHDAPCREVNRYRNTTVHRRPVQRI
jgi:hypothetical protein